MFLADISRARIEGWNQRVLTEKDAVDYCKRNNIYVVDDRKTPYGRIVFRREYVFIVINPLLEPAMRLWVLWHEIAHFILHSPHNDRFSPLTKRKNDREANYIAAVAMMPRAILEGRTLIQIQHEYGYPDALVKIRNTIVQNEGL